MRASGPTSIGLPVVADGLAPGVLVVGVVLRECRARLALGGIETRLRESYQECSTYSMTLSGSESSTVKSAHDDAGGQESIGSLEALGLEDAPRQEVAYAAAERGSARR